MNPAGATPSVQAVDGVRLAAGDLAGLDDLRPETIAVFWFSDVRPLAGGAAFLDWRLCGALSRRIETGQFAGRHGEVMLLPVDGRLGRQRVFLFGLDSLAQCDRMGLRQAAREAFDVMQGAGATKIVFVAPWVQEGDVEAEFVRAVAEELPNKVDAVLVGS